MMFRLEEILRFLKMRQFNELFICFQWWEAQLTLFFIAVGTVTFTIFTTVTTFYNKIGMQLICVITKFIFNLILFIFRIRQFSVRRLFINQDALCLNNGSNSIFGSFFLNSVYPYIFIHHAHIKYMVRIIFKKEFVSMSSDI